MESMCLSNQHLLASGFLLCVQVFVYPYIRTGIYRNSGVFLFDFHLFLKKVKRITVLAMVHLQTLL